MISCFTIDSGKAYRHRRADRRTNPNDGLAVHHRDDIESGLLRIILRQPLLCQQPGELRRDGLLPTAYAAVGESEIDNLLLEPGQHELDDVGRKVCQSRLGIDV